VNDKLPPHPGFIEFVDAKTGEVTKRESVSAENEGIAYVEGRDGTPQPVVRIVISRDPPEIKQFGVGGALLKVTRG
jgi:hypothetical protein